MEDNLIVPSHAYLATMGGIRVDVFAMSCSKLQEGMPTFHSFMYQCSSRSYITVKLQELTASTEYVRAGSEFAYRWKLGLDL